MAELETLRQEATTEPALDDSESVAGRVAEAEELALAQSTPPVAMAPVLVAVPTSIETIEPPPYEEITLVESISSATVPAPVSVETIEPLPVEDTVDIESSVPAAVAPAMSTETVQPPPDEDAPPVEVIAAAPAHTPDPVESIAAAPIARASEPVTLAIVEPPPRTAAVVVPRPAPTPIAPLPESESLLAVSDDVDKQVLPIFLEEAAELFPQASEQLRAWRKKPGDVHPANGLKRTLHTFKGSARMAGAMRLGELTHLMESRLPESEALGRPSPELLDALDNDLDHIAFMLDRLQKGVNTDLPVECHRSAGIGRACGARSRQHRGEGPVVATIAARHASATSRPRRLPRAKARERSCACARTSSTTS